jgi:hypothetical protein
MAQEVGIRGSEESIEIWILFTVGDQQFEFHDWGEWT